MLNMVLTVVFYVHLFNKPKELMGALVVLCNSAYLCCIFILTVSPINNKSSFPVLFPT